MEELKFEKALERLEKIVEYLEGGEVVLDEALKKYEEGVKLVRLCSEKLAQAEKKIEMLNRSLDGKLKVVPFGEELCDSEEEAGEKGSKRKELL
jgi:exodeoxyribonuclease VII small subunit